MAAIPTHTLQARFKRIEIILIKKSRYEKVICHTVKMYPFVTDIRIKNLTRKKQLQNVFLLKTFNPPRRFCPQKTLY